MPTSPPVYPAAPRKVTGRRRIPFYQGLSALFIALALLNTIWLTGVLLFHPAPNLAGNILNVVLFWLALTYLVLPRLHQLLTVLYVPDYFIGRTHTGDGLLGDPVNLALDGTEDDIHAAMLGANWVRADPITPRSALGIVRSTLLRRPYPAAPVSNLYLFEHPQAFAYQQEVDGNAAQRHHVRFWPTPPGWLLPGGLRVAWLAAGTYDRSVGLSSFTLQITHKIDADIDVERDYIIDTVRYADPDCGVRVLPDFTTAYHARNGGGDAIRTDGDLPVLDVTGAAERNRRAARPRTESTHVADRALPPTPLLLGGALIAVLFLISVVTYLLAGGTAGQDAVTWLFLEGAWLLAAFRHRWAWLLLMTIATLISAGGLLAITLGLLPGEGNLYLVSIAVLVVLAVSSEDVREWLGKERSHPRQIAPQPPA